MFGRLRRALVAGFLILLPALLAYLLLGGFYDLIVLLTAPVLDLLPDLGWFPSWGRNLVGIGIMCAVFVAVGLIRHTGPARRLGQWLEHGVSSRFPPYRIVRDITRRLSGEEMSHMHAVLVPLGDGAKTVGFIVEELHDGLVTVFIPLTSIPTIGDLRIMPRVNLEPVAASFMDSLGWYFNWGRGTEALIGRTNDGANRPG